MWYAHAVDSRASESPTAEAQSARPPPRDLVTPLPFVWPYALLFWSVDAWAYWPEFGILRRARLIGNLIALLAAFPLAWAPALQITGHRVGVFLLGVAVQVSGSLLRRHCWRMLGASFTGDVRASPDQEVVTRGAYAILRHPSYTAAIMLHTGVGIALGSWASALILAVASLAVYTYRITVEERALLAAIGEPYERFMRTRKRLIPFVY